MAAIRTARERAREELTREIKDEARRQLGVEGAQQLSVRAVARELGMASSALYRYFPSRDELLTALIMDAYISLADSAEQAVAAARAAAGQPAAGRPGAAQPVVGGSAVGGLAAGGPGAGRAAAREAAGQAVRPCWRAFCGAVRDWAREHPHEYALIYGTPVPGYHAPQETIELAVRLPLTLLDLVRPAAGRLEAPAGRPVPPVFSAQLAALAAQYAPELPQAALARVMVAWTQLFGMISFELFGHLAGSADPADEFFAHAVEQMADFVGLPAGDQPKEM
ncbi:AcrR family transcriptional regulator [Kitasatospora sp. MAA4]|uniref:TetR/AcrR family transcriptional regulator n=1 Tax=Kitasatospora sp. MAA4 TaxID=3035093 RepID=UPI0024765E81|nr:TetR/AcrR family transcriptional regulator [Kitasatospora sp. MAA4]MDH6132980.1 AcrR family transcriptional regulator [Kitasatospora sp. MAA4]